MTYQARQREAELRGEAKGREAQAKASAIRLYKRGDDPVEIADVVSYVVDTARQWAGLLPS